jgi:nucleotide-binding universal stress UspA family protein
MPVGIKKIVIPVDFSPASEQAARYGCALARSLDARVYLIHVLEPSLAVSMDSVHREAADARAALLAMAQQIAPEARPITEVRIGSIAASITKAVVAYGGDLVVMGTHGRTGFSHLVHGSIAEEVIRTVPSPVLVVRENGVRMHQAQVAA